MTQHASVTVEGFVNGMPTGFTEVVPTTDDAEGVRHTLTY